MPDRTALLAEADSILHKTSFTKEDASRVEQLISLADQFTDRTDLRAATMSRHGRELGREPQIVSKPDAKFSAYLRNGASVLSPEERRRIGSERSSPIRAAQTEGTGSAGGYIVPQSFADRFESILQKTDGLFQMATMFSTATGTTSPYPILDDVANEAAVVAEGGTSNQGPDFVLAALVFGACPTWRSGVIRANIELVNDSAFDFEALFAGAAAVRFARGVGAAFVATLLTSAALGVTAAGTTAVTGDEIFALVDSVDPEYANNGSFLMKRTTYSTILKLKGSGSGNYLFKAEFDGMGRPTLLGFPVSFSPSMGAMTTALKPISFGDHTRFIRRQVRDSLQVKTYVELYAAAAAIGYEAFLRVDGDLLKSGSNVPVKYLQLHA
jgi:HK97 family phage major capsid protein